MVEPPRAPALTVATRGADFSTVQQVTLADDADQTSARIDDWGTADAVFRKQACQGLNRRIRINRNHVGVITSIARIAYLPIVNRTTFAGPLGPFARVFIPSRRGRNEIRSRAWYGPLVGLL